MRLRSLTLAFIAAMGLATGAQAAPKSAAAHGPVLIVKTAQGSHVVGRAGAPLKLVEYVSYTCPHCAAFESEGAEAVQQMLVRPGKGSIEYRPFLRNAIDVAATLLVNCGPAARFPGNQRAVMLSQAKWMVQPTEEQVQRWNAGDLPTRLRAMAGDLHFYELFAARGYKRAELDQCLADEAQVKAIAQENSAAVQAGVAGTPTFLIDGMMQDAHNWADLRPLLEAALK